MQKEGIEALFLKKHKQYTCNFGVAEFCIATDTVYAISDIQYQ